MNIYKLEKSSLIDLFRSLNEDFEVMVPTIENGNLLFGNLNECQPASDFKGSTSLSPKEFLFPQREKTLTFNTADTSNIKIDTHFDETKRIIWGIRPCDLKGIKTLDTIFSFNYVDPYYETRRKNTILMGLNCNEPCDYGFCDSCQSGPFANGDYDILFTDLGSNYLVNIGSKAGEQAISKSLKLFKQSTAADQDKAKDLEKASRKAFKNTTAISMAQEKLPQFWDDVLWEQESVNCLLCGGCNFVCPTCHCYNIEDIACDKQISTRIKYWDSCQLAGFTQMAAENTRSTQAERLRQRIFHKIVYTSDQYKGVPGCTGCGRCIEVCPAEIDITHIIRRISTK